MLARPYRCHTRRARPQSARGHPTVPTHWGQCRRSTAGLNERRRTRPLEISQERTRRRETSCISPTRVANDEVRSPVDDGRFRIHTNHAGNATSNKGVTNTTVKRGSSTNSRSTNVATTSASTMPAARRQGQQRPHCALRRFKCSTTSLTTTAVRSVSVRSSSSSRWGVSRQPTEYRGYLSLSTDGRVSNKSDGDRCKHDNAGHTCNPVPPATINYQCDCRVPG